MFGTIGQLLILMAFVACALSGFAFLRAAHQEPTGGDWKQIGRAAWGVMSASVISAFGILIYLLLTHQFEYAYVHQHSSLTQPTHFLVSAAWAGQEGSFMLWIIMNSVVGLALMRWARDWESTTMTVVAFCQVFLISMVVGLNLGAFTLGASPFITLAEKFPDAPMLQTGLVPSDGQGLNDLLQNYWMVIHPPTLFVGFASMIVPFAFAVSALWKRRYTQWVKPALPWALFAVMILGIGIAMGGYWAYVTLSFGGYWAWDPVENSSLVPWIIGIAAIHTMIVQKRSGSSQKAALFLCILAYMLVIYSTFLTRSGILGDISVHSFVDLGLYNQLLLWILSMGVVGFGLFAYRYRQLPIPKREPDYLSREFMIFSGAMLLCAVGAVILVGTSAPILGRIFLDRPASVPIAFYNNWTLPLSVGFVFLAGLGQLFWWNKMSVENVNRVLLKPIVLAVVCTVAVLLFTPFVEETAAVAASLPPLTQAGVFGDFWQMYGLGLGLLLLVFVAFFAFFGNGLVLWRIARGNPKLAGGAFAHVGFAIMVLGVVASSGFSEKLGGETRNVVLERGTPRLVDGYQFTYTGQRPNEEGRPTYRLDITNPVGQRFSVAPVVYRSNQDQWIQHPEVQLGFIKDLFVAVTPKAMVGGDDEQPGRITVARGDSLALGDDEYLLRFVDYDTTPTDALPDSTQIAVGAILDITNRATGETRTITPIYLIMNDRAAQTLPVRLDEWDLTVAFVGMNVNTGAVDLAVEGVTMPEEDWLVVQAYEKPMINLVWIGILLFSFGFGIALYRRAADLVFDKKRQPNPEA